MIFALDLLNLEYTPVLVTVFIWFIVIFTLYFTNEVICKLIQKLNHSNRKWSEMTGVETALTTVTTVTILETTVITETAETTIIVITGISVTTVTITVEEWVVAGVEEDIITLTTAVECATKQNAYPQ